MPGDDEQRVVDSHAQPDQDAQRRADRGNAHLVGEEPDGHQAGGQRGDRDCQGQQHGQQRPERDEQHDGRAHDSDGRAEAERRLQCVLHRRPAGFDLHAGCPRGLGEVDDAGDVRYGQASFRGVEDDGRVGDLPVAADLGGAGGGVRAHHGRDRGCAGDLAQHGRDLGAEGRGAHATRAGGPPDDRVLVPGVPGECLFQQGKRGGGAGPGQGHVVRVRGPRGPAADPQDDHERQPCDEHPRAALEAPARQNSHVSLLSLRLPA